MSDGHRALQYAAACETAGQPGYDGYLETIMLRVALFEAFGAMATQP